MGATTRSSSSSSPTSGPGPGLHAADVEEVGALVDEHLGPAEQRVELVGEPWS